ncbi:MAG: PEP-CTERM sorting domain-containing protein [Pseudomonadota bacterium]|nr:PEP-CTERM sorting domain-containing protein [Pseudomonadota bacterium]
MNKLHAFLAAAAIVASSAASSAETYGSINVPPGVYFGSGNPNGNFNISTGNNLELALRAKNRTPVGPVLIDGSSGVYSVPAGFCTSGCGSPKAKWNYEFSIHTVDGSSLSNYTFLLGVDHDASAGTAFTYIDPLTYWSDNAKDGFAGVQNSENISFGNTPGGAINANAAGLYDFILLGYASNGQLIGQVDMTVQVPEPGSFALFGLGLAGLAVFLRRKLKA